MASAILKLSQFELIIRDLSIKENGDAFFVAPWIHT